jgi:hypothetical protein
MSLIAGARIMFGHPRSRTDIPNAAPIVISASIALKAGVSVIHYQNAPALIVAARIISGHT